MTNQTVMISRELLERLIDPYAPDFQSHVEVRAALSVSAQPAGEYGDAYQGAREDLAIWKRRALEAEQKIHHQEQIIDSLVLEAHGEARMGEPHIAQPAGEVPEVLLTALRQYRHNYGSEELIVGYEYEETNRIVAALQALAADPDKMADRFISWKLPDSVRPDACAMNPEYPHRYGTNLMTWAQAKEMFECVLAETAVRKGEQ